MLKKGNRANTLHGILLIVLFSFAAFYIAGFPLVKKLSFSPLIVGREFLYWTYGLINQKELKTNLPEGYYGIYNVQGKEGFVGRNKDY